MAFNLVCSQLIRHIFIQMNVSPFHTYLQVDYIIISKRIQFLRRQIIFWDIQFLILCPIMSFHTSLSIVEVIRPQMVDSGKSDNEIIELTFNYLAFWIHYINDLKTFSYFILPSIHYPVYLDKIKKTPQSFLLFIRIIISIYLVMKSLYFTNFFAFLCLFIYFRRIFENKKAIASKWFCE